MSMFLGTFLDFLGKWKGNNALSAVGNVLNPLGSILNHGSSLLNSVTGAGLTGAESQQNAWNAQQAQIARDWDEEMYLKYNSPQALMSQYREAGLNPALMYGQNVSGNAPSSSPVAEGVSPSGGLDLGQLVSLMGLKSEIDANKANARARNAEAEGKEIDNKYKDRLGQLNVDKSELTAENLRKQGEKILADIEKVKQEIKTEEERTIVTKWQGLYQKALANKTDEELRQLVALFDYNVDYLVARTENERASAAASWAKAAYDRGLIDSGYIEQLARSVWNENQESLKRQGIMSVQELNAKYDYAIRTGQLFDDSTAMNRLRNRIIRSMSLTGDCIRGVAPGLSGTNFSYSSSVSQSSGSSTGKKD